MNSDIEGMGSFIVIYSIDSGTTWTKNAPTDAGTYQVGVLVETGTNYASALVTDPSWMFTIVAQVSEGTNITEDTSGNNTTEGASSDTIDGNSSRDNTVDASLVSTASDSADATNSDSDSPTSSRSASVSFAQTGDATIFLIAGLVLVIVLAGVVGVIAFYNLSDNRRS